MCLVCDLWQKTPKINYKTRLYCEGCPFITEVPDIFPQLNYLNCDDCPNLT